jgi:hypothetical protein
LLIGDGEIGAQKRGNGCVRRNSLVSSRNFAFVPPLDTGVRAGSAEVRALVRLLVVFDNFTDSSSSA